MGAHSDSTEQHQLQHADLVYADEATLAAATPASALYHRIGYATSERTYWLWTQDGWLIIFNPQGGSWDLSRAVVHDDAVITHGGEIVII